VEKRGKKSKSKKGERPRRNIKGPVGRKTTTNGREREKKNPRGDVPDVGEEARRKGDQSYHEGSQKKENISQSPTLGGRR